MSRLFLYFLLLPMFAQAAPDMDRLAAELVQRYPLVDTHIDVPYRISHHWEDVTGATEQGQFDYPRAVAGGLNIPFMSIYTAATSELDNSAYRQANNLIDQVEAIVQRAPDKFALVDSSAAAAREFRAGKIALALGMEMVHLLLENWTICATFSVAECVTSPWPTACPIISAIPPTMMLPCGRGSAPSG